MEPVATSPRALTRAQCLDLLRGTGVGRIAYSQRALPAIVMVGYAVLEDAVVLRLDADAPELPWLRNGVVAFQTDCTEPGAHTGWSVTCVGRARQVTDPDQVLALLGVGQAVAGETKPAFLWLEAELVEGRVFHELPLADSRHLTDAAAPAS